MTATDIHILSSGSILQCTAAKTHSELSAPHVGGASLIIFGPGLFLNMGSGGSKIQSGTQIFWQIYFVPKTSLFAFLGFTRAVVGSISKIGQFFDHLNFLKI